MIEYNREGWTTVSLIGIFDKVEYYETSNTLIKYYNFSKVMLYKDFISGKIEGQSAFGTKLFTNYDNMQNFIIPARHLHWVDCDYYLGQDCINYEDASALDDLLVDDVVSFDALLSITSTVDYSQERPSRIYSFTTEGAFNIRWYDDCGDAYNKIDSCIAEFAV